jgi:excisionase family DNA binding protein
MRTLPETTPHSRVETRLIGLDSPLLRAEEAAQLLQVRRSWIYDAVRSGALPCLRVGRHIRFTRPMLEEWLRGRCA